MTSSCEESRIQAILHDFCAAMLAWEKNVMATKSHTDARGRLQAYKHLDEIFTRYCTSKDRKKDRQSALDVSLEVSYPSEYDFDNQHVIRVELAGDSALVYTEQPHGLNNQYRYTFFRQDGDWKLDSKACFFRDDGKYHSLFNDCFGWKTRFDSEKERAASAYARASKLRLTGDNEVWHAPLPEIVEHFRQKCLHARDSLDIQQIGTTFDLYGQAGKAPQTDRDGESTTDALLKINQCYYVIYDSIVVAHDDLDRYEEIYPAFAVENKLELMCYGTIVMDVIECALDEAKQYGMAPDTAFLVGAINYYNENDCFLEFEPSGSKTR